jgi:hypothetical protein
LFLVTDFFWVFFLGFFLDFDGALEK